jgi:Periplasmic copper-binding protein (NosD)/PA14 domain
MIAIPVGLALTLVATAPPDTIALTAGLVIDRSVVVRPGRYRLAPPPGDSVAVRIRGAGVTVDFQGAVLEGTDPAVDDDARSGIGILIEEGTDVTLRRARIRGYRVGVLAHGVRGLFLADNDVSDNWRPRLWSGPGHESLVDWLSFHHNERDEWLRYGAGFYLADVVGGDVRGNTAERGMNGLLLARSSGLRIWNNDFSFLSGLGIGLYRSTETTIMHNRLDWCIRGYVSGVYQRGQDSAALLLYEQSSNNVVAYNSMTHSGDGLFLWAGQSTMDTGAGGANDNLVFGNDLSFAAANGIEVTFSRNRLIGNLLEGSTYGVWGGYSFETEIRGNRFRNNTTGIAIEHGQHNTIVDNRFEGDRTAISLWQNPIAPSDWGYPKHRDTRSRDYRIEGNQFRGHGVALRLRATTGVTFGPNGMTGVDTAIVASGDTTDWRFRGVTAPDPPDDGWELPRDDAAAPTPLPGGIDPMIRGAARGGREAILVDRWGPYDWRSPRLWRASVGDSAYAGGPLSLRVLGPPGRWRLVSSRGVRSVRPAAGSVGDTLAVRPTASVGADWSVTLEYVGQAVTDPHGAQMAAGTPVRFDHSEFVPTQSWEIRVASWDSSDDLSGHPERAASLLAAAPLLRRQNGLDYLWTRPPFPGVPSSRFGLRADGVVSLPAGRFRLTAISDDGVRVWVDDRLVIDHWAPHESAVDQVALDGGRHRVRIEYYQVDGWVELRLAFERLRQPAGR